jgi:hypothetical protein
MIEVDGTQRDGRRQKRCCEAETMADACPNGSKSVHTKRKVFRLVRVTRMHCNENSCIRSGSLPGHVVGMFYCTRCDESPARAPSSVVSRRIHAKSFLATLLPSKPSPGDSALRFIAPLPLRGGLPRVSSGARARGRSSARGLGSEEGGVGLGYDEKNRCRRAWSSGRDAGSTHLCRGWTRRWIIA